MPVMLIYVDGTFKQGVAAQINNKYYEAEPGLIHVFDYMTRDPETDVPTYIETGVIKVEA